jgi:hypothetical protein
LSCAMMQASPQQPQAVPLFLNPANAIHSFDSLR